jgi:hypothetical protein
MRLASVPADTTDQLVTLDSSAVPAIVFLEIARLRVHRNKKPNSPWDRAYNERSRTFDPTGFDRTVENFHFLNGKTNRSARRPPSTQVAARTRLTVLGDLHSLAARYVQAVGYTRPPLSSLSSRRPPFPNRSMFASSRVHETALVKIYNCRSIPSCSTHFLLAGSLAITSWPAGVHKLAGLLAFTSWPG